MYVCEWCWNALWCPGTGFDSIVKSLNKQGSIPDSFDQYLYFEDGPQEVWCKKYSKLSSCPRTYVRDEPFYTCDRIDIEEAEIVSSLNLRHRSAGAAYAG